MDKLKDALNKPQVFWFTCIAVGIVSLACWFFGAGGVFKDAKAGASKVASHFKMVIDIGRGGTDHPNQKWLEDIDVSIDKQKEAVRDEWDAFFKKQHEDVFVWPERLSPEFLAAVKTPELDGELEPPLRDEYLNEVDKWFPELAERVAFGLAEGQTPGENALPLVTWGEAKAGGTVGENAMVNDINLRHFKWTERPSTERIRIAQEDYWVLKALCEIIIEANGRSTGPHETVVQTIETMAIANSEELIASFSRDKTKGRFTLYGMEAKKGKDIKTPARRGQAAPDMSEIDRLTDNRYVDEVGVGVSYKKIKENKEELKEYRLMPIQMMLSVDKSRILELLGAFANSDLPVEVLQVRFNSSKAGAKNDNVNAKKQSNRFGRFEIFAVAYLVKGVNDKHLELPEPPKPQAAVAGGGQDAAKPGT